MDFAKMIARHEGHDHSEMDMGSMDMGSNTTAETASSMDMGMGSCKISMLWNWYTVDSCFLAETWHNKTKGAFAGSVIGVFLLVILIEGFRRLAREYDRKLVNAAMVKHEGGSDGAMTPSVSEEGKTLGAAETQCRAPFEFTPSWTQQLLRAFAYGTQFTASFLVMLLGMYFNGYILFAIFIGHTVGYFAFARDTGASASFHTGSGHCC